MKARHVLVVLMLVLLSVAIYFGSLDNAVTNWDDGAFVTDSQGIRNFDLKILFGESILQSYYPITLITLAVDSSLCGADPFCFHVSSLVFHILNGCLLFFLVISLFKVLTGASQFYIAALIAAVYVAHPLNVEAVSWIASRNQVVSGTFQLLTLLAYLRYLNENQRRWSWNFWISFLFFCFALLSKSMAVVMPAVLFSLDMLKNRKDWVRIICEKILFLVPALLLLLKTLHIRSLLIKPLPEVHLMTGFEHLLWAGRLIVFYLSRGIFPRNLSAYYDILNFSLDAIDGVIVSAVAGLCLFLWWRRRQILWKPALLGVVVFVVGILPVLKLIPFGEYSIAQDRYMYFPLMGLLLTLFSTLNLNSKLQKSIAAAFAMVLVGALGWASYQKTKDWDSSETLWRSVLRTHPGTAVAENNLGVLYLRRKIYPEARQHFLEALRSRPNHATAYFNLGMIEAETGNESKAIDYLKHAVDIWPEYEEAHNNLGFIYSRHKETMPQAIEHIKASVKTGASHPEVFFNLAIAQIATGEPATAKENLKFAMKRWPEFRNSHFLMGELLLKEGKTQEAIEYFQQAADPGSNVRAAALLKLKELENKTR